MGDLNQEIDFLELGKTIVNELNYGTSVDTLGRWLSHYLAQKITEAEKCDDEGIKKECLDLIIKIWEHRQSGPKSIQPLGSILDNLLEFKRMNSDAGNVWDNVETSDKWMKYLKVSMKSSQKMNALSFLYSFASANFENSLLWKRKHGDSLSEEESQIIESLDSWMREERLFRFINIKSEEPRVELHELNKSDQEKRIFSMIEEEYEKITLGFHELKTSIFKAEKVAKKKVAKKKTAKKKTVKKKTAKKKV